MMEKGTPAFRRMAGSRILEPDGRSRLRPPDRPTPPPFLRARGLKMASFGFAHAALHPLPGGRLLADSSHCSRYNTNTGRLTEAMFHDVFAAIRARLRAGH